MSSLFGVPGPKDDIGFPPGGKPLDIISQKSIGIAKFQRKERARRARISPEDEEAREMRRRIAARGGAQSTLLAGRSSALGGNIFKSNLGGTSRKRLS